MKERLLQMTAREYSASQRTVALFFEGPFFMLLLPFFLARAGRALDRRLHLPRLPRRGLTLFVAILLGAPGWALALWSIVAQFRLGRGTPVPLMATQKLVVEPPYTYSRNPMALGTILMYLGVAIALGSLGAVGLVLLFGALLLGYIKGIEEGEMEARFGTEYERYRERTPFLIPYLW